MDSGGTRDVKLTANEAKILVETFDLSYSELEQIDEHNPELAKVVRKLLRAAGASE